jgi:hypothetical protein
MRGEVHQGVDPVIGKHGFQQCGVARIADDQFATGDGFLEARTEVVKRYDLFTLQPKLAQDVAADVSGTAGQKYLVV